MPVTAFTLNGQELSETPFVPPQVSPNDLVGAPMFPHAGYFQRPTDLEPGQKLTVRLHPDHPMFGQAFGYIAPKGQCILDLDPNECWIVPPSPTDYNFAHQGRTVLMDGTELETANIGGGAGHAATTLGWKQVPLFYENTSFQLASVRYGEDNYGVWAAGVLVPETTWGRALQLMRSATSGDWRWVDELRAWDFMGSCLVNIPGYPIYDGTKVVMKASATVLDPERAMLVTFSGAQIDKDEHDMSGTATTKTACSCNGASQTADPETPAGPTFDQEAVQTMIASAIEANNAVWETKVAEIVTPLAERLGGVEQVAASLL